jgi:molybdopterin-synthase adenylyltransferase
MLTERDRERYRRQLLIPGWGEEAQQKLKNSKVLIAGAGGLGSPVAYYLAAAGVGSLVICDDGKLELSNCNRQILYWETDLGVAKAEAAAERIYEFNRDIEILPLSERIDDDSIERLAGGADLIVDCLDNFETRYVLNRFSVRTKMPFVHAGVSCFAGQLTFIAPPETPCLACIFPEVPEQETVPILGTTTGVIGSLSAMEACKYLAGVGENIKSKLIIWDGEEQIFDTVEITKSETCPVCGKQKE